MLTTARVCLERVKNEVPPVLCCKTMVPRHPWTRVARGGRINGEHEWSTSLMEIRMQDHTVTIRKKEDVSTTMEN